MKSQKIIFSILIFIILLVLGSFYIYKYSFFQYYDKKGLNVLYIILVILTIATIFGIIFSYKTIRNSKNIIPQQGVKGKVGYRGSAGERASPLDSCNDELCYQKIMNHITNVYNVWRVLHSKPMLPDGKHIKNQYIKGKAKEMCDSEEYKNLLKQFGAHKLNLNDNPLNSTKCDINKDCGAYDYILQKWTEWIFIILKYEQGEHFLNSAYSTEKEFNNMITENDYKKTDITKEWVFNLGQPLMAVLLDKDGKEALKKNINNLKSSEFGIFYMTKGVPSAHFIDKSSMKTEEKFFKILSPFEEIKKYDAWYWGTSVNLTPQIINHCEIIEDNILDKYKNKIKIKISTDYTTLWNSKEACQKRYKIKESTKFNYLYEDSQLFGNKDITILRPNYFTDNQEKDLFFKTYKPVGDVLFDSTSNVFSQKQTVNDVYPIQTRFENIESSLHFEKTGPQLQTIMVSGDTKPPIDYQLMFSALRKEGYNKNKLALNIWRPVAPEGYVALGDVIDVSTSVLKPDTNIIACVPENSVKQLNIDSLDNKKIWDSKNDNIINLLDEIATLDSPNTDIIGDKHIILYSNKNYKLFDQKDSKPIEITDKHNNKRVFLKSDLEFKEDNRIYQSVISPYLENYNIIRSKKPGSNNDEIKFYTIQSDYLYYEGEEKIKKNVDIYPQKKNPLNYSILSIYN